MTARAMVLEAPHTLRPREFALPDVGDDDALLRVEACGLCGTDHEQYSGQLHPGHPFVPGHEAVGVIEEIGPAAEQRWGVTRGQRVAVEVFQSCRECDACRSGGYRRCERNGLATMYGFVSVDVHAREESTWPHASFTVTKDGVIESRACTGLNTGKTKAQLDCEQRQSSGENVPLPSGKDCSDL